MAKKTNESSMSFDIEKFEKAWIEEKIEKDMVIFTDNLGKYLCDLPRGGNRPGYNAMTTTQLRNIFGEVKRIQRAGILSNQSSFILLKPKLAYAEAREKDKKRDSRISTFRQVIEKAHDAVKLGQGSKTEASFQRFVDFLEAILAYHKAYGGKDK